MERFARALGALTLTLGACGGDDASGGRKSEKGTTTSFSSSTSTDGRGQGGQGQNGQGQNGQGQGGQGQGGQGQQTDGTATLVIVNQSDWMEFDLVLLVVCGSSGALYEGFWVDDWLEPGEDWTLTGVPTDTCYQVEVWDTFADIGLSWTGTTYDPGEHVLRIVD